MNQQDKPDDEPEKTETESSAEGEEGQKSEDAAEDGAKREGEPPAEDDTTSDDTITAEDDAAGPAIADEDEYTAAGDSRLDAVHGRQAGTGSGDDETSEDAEPRTIDLDRALGTSTLISDGMPAEPAAEAEPEPVADAHEPEEEEHHRSLAARALTWLVLLIAGAGLALWAAPRIAPHLPSGLGPVKAWLMPGALQTEAELAALAERLDSRIDSLQQAADEPRATEEQIQAAIADLEGRVTPRLDELSDQVGATDREAFEGRLTQLETRVEGLAAQIEELTGLGAGSAELSDEDLARISAFSSTVEGLRAEVASLAEKQGVLSQRIDDVAAAAQRRLAEAEEEVAAANQAAEATKSAALARAAAISIDAAITAGEPYAEALDQLRANTGVEIPEGLAASAETGVTPLGTLRESFPDAAHAAIRASIRAEDDSSVAGRLASFIEAQVASRSLTPQPGDSTDAILSRAEDALRRDNLAAAVSELDSLSEPARNAMADWIARAEARVAAQSALRSVNSALAAGN